MIGGNLNTNGTADEAISISLDAGANVHQFLATKCRGRFDDRLLNAGGVVFVNARSGDRFLEMHGNT